VAPDDLRDFPLPDWHTPAEEQVEWKAFAMNPAAGELPEEALREPTFDAGPVPTGPVLIGFDHPDPAEPDPKLELAHLDPGRGVGEPDVPLALSVQQRREWAVGVAGALGAHLLPLLVLLPWPITPAPLPAPIAVTIVLEAPPPEPKPEPKPPAGRLASADLGDPTAKPPKPRPAAAAAPVDEPKLTHAAATALPRKALPRPELVSALPKPAPLPEAELKLAEPEVKPAVPDRAAPAKPPIRYEAAARSTPHPSADPRWGRVPGPAATQDEYLAYANALIRRNQELIPASLLKGRNGTAVISILVLADGTIARIAIKESSGYPDIDQRAERMVAAVKRFPALPQWFQATSMLLSYHMLFGDRMVLP
jgi:TonB family protein